MHICCVYNRIFVQLVVSHTVRCSRSDFSKIISVIFCLLLIWVCLLSSFIIIFSCFEYNNVSYPARMVGIFARVVRNALFHQHLHLMINLRIFFTLLRFLPELGVAY